MPESLLQYVSILTPNETEASMLSGIAVKDEKSALKAAQKILSFGVQIVIVTLGSLGALIVTEEKHELIPGFPVKAVDTTAAGDIFNGALSVAIAEDKMDLLNCVRFANAAAAISVTRFGAQPSAPKRKEIEQLLGKYKK